MEIKVAKQYLEKALAVVFPGVDPKASDITGHFVFRVQGGEAEVLTENSRVFSSCPIVCQVDEDGGFTIEAKRLKKWLGSIQDGPLTLQLKDEGNVEVMSDEGSLPLQSLDPSTFPYWDGHLKKVEKAHKKREAALAKGENDVPPPVKFEVEASRLSAALGYVKNFISNQETVHPHLAVTEVKKGSLMATNGGAATMVKVQGLEESSMRIHRMDISATVSFLNQAGKEVIEVLESDRSVVFRRSDGSLFGVTKTTDAFPNLNQDQFVDPEHWWEMSPEAVANAINFIQAAADWNDEDINIEDEGDGVTFWMPAFHSKKRAKRVLECVDRSRTEDGEITAKVEEFRLHRETILTVLSAWSGKVVRFDLYPQSKNSTGFIRLQEDRDGDVFSTILAHRR